MDLTLTLTGTGTSTGVPMIACDCDVCRSTNPKDQRLRCGAMLQFTDPTGTPRTVLIDTPPDLRLQMIRHQVMGIDGVLYTHSHADHTFGIDDLRRFNAAMQQPITIYGDRKLLDALDQRFEYIFHSHKNINQSFVANLIPHELQVGQTVELFGLPVTPVRLLHGRLPILGYRIADAAYCTDVSAFPPQTLAMLQNLDLLVIDALRDQYHPTHLTIDRALQYIDDLKPRRACLTHLSHFIAHDQLQARMPEHVHVGYDNIQFQLQGPEPDRG